MPETCNSTCAVLLLKSCLILFTRPPQETVPLVKDSRTRLQWWNKCGKVCGVLLPLYLGIRPRGRLFFFNPLGLPLPSLYRSLFTANTMLPFIQSLPNRFPINPSKALSVDLYCEAIVSNRCKWQLRSFKLLFKDLLTFLTVTWFNWYISILRVLLY